MQRQERVERFRALGIAESQIYTEILRAREIDQVLFQRADHREYGVTGETITAALHSFTIEKFGPYPADPEQYPEVYGMAMATPPLLFSSYREKSYGPALTTVWEEANQSEHVLLVHADGYLGDAVAAKTIFQRAPKIVATAADEKAAAELQLLYPYYAWTTLETLPADDFDYIFVGSDAATAEELQPLTQTRPAARIDAWLLFDGVRDREQLPAGAWYLYGADDEKLYWIGHPDSTQEKRYGMARFSDGRWEKEIYFPETWRAWQTTQEETTLQHYADPLPMQSAPTEGVALTAALNDGPWPLAAQKESAPREVAGPLASGDVVIAATQDGYRVGIITAKHAGKYLAGRAFVMRPRDMGKAAWLWMTLQTDRVRAQLASLLAGDFRYLTPALLGRLPLGNATADAIHTAQAWLARQNEWEEVQTRWEESMHMF